MTYDILPGSLFRIPTRTWDDDDSWSISSPSVSNISISEDDKYVYVQAGLPGVDPKDIEVTFDKGLVWIKGETKEEEKSKKFYRKATSQFSYRVAVPGDIDPNKDPEASCKNGVMTVTFAKSPAHQPKKITVKESK